MANKLYNSQVFINCPFDGEYLNLFRACVFTILDAGFIPRCSKEISNATEFRLKTIVEIIRECRFGIHDLSRIELDAKTRLPRFNMPFELGVFYSAKHFGSPIQKRKDCLVLEKERFRYQKFISDIAGIDVKGHRNNTKRAIHSIRDWLVTSSKRTTIPPGTIIHKRFEKFQSEIRQACQQKSIDYDSMTFIELIDNMTAWLRINQATNTSIFEN